jgi:hypothetical protein
VTLTAIVAGGAGAASPTGAVTFAVDGVMQPAVPLVVVNGQAQATLVLNGLTTGNHNVSAVYAGDANNAGSNSLAVVVVVIPAPLTAPAPLVAPVVVSVRSLGVSPEATALVLQFNEALDSARAEDLANYQIVGPNRRVVAIRTAVYDLSTNTVTLTLVRPINMNLSYRLTVSGTGPQSIASASGILLDGSGTGPFGSDYVTQLTVASFAPQPSAAARPGHRAHPHHHVGRK